MVEEQTLIHDLHRPIGARELINLIEAFLTKHPDAEIQAQETPCGYNLSTSLIIRSKPWLYPV